MDEVKLFAIRDRLKYLTELEERRAVVIKAISEAGKMTPELQAKIEQAPTKAELEDLYMPYRSRRRTRSAAAKQKGLEPLAELIWKQELTTGTVEEAVTPFVNAEKGVKDLAEALAGARDIVAERIAEHAECRKIARDLLVNEGKVVAKAREGVDLAKGKFAGYAQFSEPLTKIPSHRILAVMRGASEKQLAVVLEAPKDEILTQIKAKIITNADAILKPELVLAIEESYERLLGPSMDNELRQELKRRADLEAIEVFARNLRALLLQAPLGEKPVLAIDPGLRTGCKVAVLDATGKLLTQTIVYPDKKKKASAEAKPEEKKAEEKPADAPAGEAAAAPAPAAEATPAPAAPAEASAPDDIKNNEAAQAIAKLIQEHGIKAIAIGNGTGGREADLFIRDLLKAYGFSDVIRVVVNESGASIYSASPIAREEFPDLDITARGTVSIGRRLQDPLAELVKLDPKSIGVGQYQHDVDQNLLKQKLDDVVESCVNFVGVDVNTASSALLRYVAGIGPKLAKNVIDQRNTKGGYKSREELREIPGFGAKAFEQCAGFLRIRNSDNPLDNSAVHPESYPVVEKLASAAGVGVKELIGNAELLDKVDVEKFKADAGDFTLKDIISELKKPGRDPRSTFVNPEFNDDVREVKDLKEGMVLNGVVTNLTAFGAFVDVGVHQDGLVHISAITHKFIREPSEALTVGQHVKVKVLSVEKDRKRISLSIKALQEAPQRKPARGRSEAPRRAPAAGEKPAEGAAASAGPRPPRPPRSDRPRGPRPPRPPRTDAATAGNTPASSGAAASTSAPSSAPGERRERGDRRNQPARSGGPGGPGGRGPRRDEGGGRGRPPAKPEPGKPDYSKFFVKSKRKEKEKRKTEVSGASREEVREVMRSQQGSGTTLADLLKKAGVISEENK
jgi:protein Tex